MLEHQQEDDQQENQGQMFNSIDRLEGPGIGAPDIKKLKDAGHHTMESVCHSTKKELAQIIHRKPATLMRALHAHGAKAGGATQSGGKGGSFVEFG